MRFVWYGFAMTAAVLSALPAGATDTGSPLRQHNLYGTSDLGGSGVTVVSRGQSLAIACDSIRKPGADVQVVMSLDLIGGESPTGFQAVLITDQTVDGGAVRVLVPDVPDLVNHTVSLKVYVTDAHGTQACDAGHVRIV